MQNDWQWLALIFILLLILAAVVWLGHAWVTPQWPEWLRQ